MVGIALYACVAGNGSCVPRHGHGADTPRVDASLTCFSFQQAENIVIFSSRPRDQAGTNMKTKTEDDLEDIPMAYLWYVVLAITAIAVTAVVLVIRLFLEV
jgi:hypothetical protein